MGTYDQEETKKVHIISSEAVIRQHKLLSKDGTNRRKFKKFQVGGAHKRKNFQILVADLNKQAFKNAMGPNALNPLARSDTTLN